MIITTSPLIFNRMASELYDQNDIMSAGSPSGYLVNGQLTIRVEALDQLVELGQILTLWAVDYKHSPEWAANASVRRTADDQFLVTFPGVQFVVR